MFTGLIQTVGAVHSIAPSSDGARLCVSAGPWGVAHAIGDSVAVSGVCLTVSGNQEGTLSFDVVPQTLALTRLGVLRVGERVNLEGALRADGVLGGHLVTGHVDGIATLRERTDGQSGTRLRLESESDLLSVCLPQGSVTIDGVSLTISGCAAGEQVRWIEVALIPQTLAATTLRELAVGQVVNIECDHLAKLVQSAVARQLARMKPTRER